MTSIITNNERKAQKKIALLGRIDARPGKSTYTADRFHKLSNALKEKHIHATSIMYSNNTAKETEKELLNFDAVLVWINPVSPTLDGNQESRGGDDGLDAMLRRVASKGVIVSGNPETIKKMGTKKVIFDTKEMSWGLEDTNYYRTFDEFKNNFAKSILKKRDVILKMQRGSAGKDVWRLTLIISDHENPEDPTFLMLRMQNAGSDTEEKILLINLFNLLEKWMKKTGSSGIVEMQFLPRIANGMIRCYMFQNKCVGILHQLPKEENNFDFNVDGKNLYPNLNVSNSGKFNTNGLPEGSKIHSRETPAYKSLIEKLEKEWLLQLAKVVQLPANIYHHEVKNQQETNTNIRKSKVNGLKDMLPVIWDIDFIQGNDDDEYKLCEINCSCVFPNSLVNEMAEAIDQWFIEYII